jgi:hypothetical protein
VDACLWLGDNSDIVYGKMSTSNILIVSNGRHEKFSKNRRTDGGQIHHNPETRN